ncbi:PLC-like phosphodiesterase [Cystobasidium minutum MCA 4210]|uniref:PLC-like phosphodiesterase n=1 Tax=Cystobasidium minutum MCA 4210 TaxID=1397322 RepID=UPI0034CDD429|eukprot:jgi/Rhomi1/163465/estExt_Genewise1Plus.C_80039
MLGQFVAISICYFIASFIGRTAAAPYGQLAARKNQYSQYYDVQAHRGGRGQCVENTVASFAWGLISGATTLELDNGVTRDGHVIVWHDESIDPLKCKDTKPVVENDPLFPYVGKYIANLTLAQIKTLDCGSLRQEGYPFQLLYPGIKLATLEEFFDFVTCTGTPVLYNIESKVDAVFPNYTQGPEVFVEKQLATFQKYGLVDHITYQSFDWRTIQLSKKRLPALATSALADDTTIHARVGEIAARSGPSDWLGGLNIDDFQGDTVAAKLVRAAASIGADILSPSAVSSSSNASALDPTFPGYVSFVNSSMMDTAESLGLTVKPYTIDRLNTVEQLDRLGVSGIITDYPETVRRWAQEQGYSVAPTVDYDIVNRCFEKHAQFIDGRRRELL